MSLIDELRRLRIRLVDGGMLDEQSFEKIYDSALAYEGGRETYNWPVLNTVPFVEVVRPRLSFVAWAAVRKIELDRAEDICAKAKEIFGAEFFEFKKLEEPVPAGLRVGETLIRMKQLTLPGLHATLALQEEILRHANTRVLAGSLLVRNNDIDIGSYYQALSLHYAIEADAITEDLLERIEAARSRK